MAIKSPFRFVSSVSVLVQSASGPPYAVRLDVRKLYQLVKLLAFVFLLLLIGTLLFFRERERTRVLEDQVLELAIQKELTKTIAANASVSITRPIREVVSATGSASAPVESDSVLGAKQPLDSTIAEKPGQVPSRTAGQPLLAATPIQPQSNAVVQPRGQTSRLSQTLVPEGPLVRARLGQMNVSCLKEECTVNLTLMPSEPGTARGQILLVMETTMMRIGAATHTNEVRKRYLIYPGEENLERIDLSVISKLEGKPFKFSRALNTTAVFQLGKLLKPLAVNAYVFDTQRNVIHHERKLVQID